jgi:protein involved in polysaccharide export with SLBB domain
LNMCASLQKRAALWLALAVSTAALLTTNAQDAAAPVNAISATKAPVLMPWQEKLTLGPGDAMEISLYGQKESMRQIVIGPDGRFSYLQAQDVTGTGLTVDELRAHLEQILMKYHLAPRVVIAPAAFRSKKYYLLGNVQGRGAYPLDKPVTLVEAVARAHGFVVASPQRSSFTLTDFSQAFLMRRQADGSFARETVDFEALFQRGELQHNRLLAPDDYLYFPPTGLEEVYVLGAIAGTGPLPYSKDLTVLGAIAGRGGFTDAAWKERVLVVRGSLNKPETFVVNMGKTLRAAGKDFALQPKDIVYVSRTPWAKAEELLEAASSDFVRAIAVSWTGKQIGPLTK